MSSKATVTFALALALTAGGCVKAQSVMSDDEGPVSHIGSSRGDRFDDSAPPPDLTQIKIGSFEEQVDAMTRLRRDSINEIAGGYGAQLGYARRTWEIVKLLEQRSTKLSDAYDFHRVVITAPRQTGYVVPPVVQRSKDAFETKDGVEASAAREYLRVMAPGKLSPVVPTWRDWLVQVAPKAEDPPRAALPKDSTERDAFNAAMRKGWIAGVQQADLALEEATHRLERDYRGMLEYRRLVALGMMKEIKLAGANFGVTGNATEMRIGDRTVRIVNAAEFNLTERSWRPVPVGARDRAAIARGSMRPDTPWIPDTVEARGKPGENFTGPPSDRRLQHPAYDVCKPGETSSKDKPCTEAIPE